MKNKIKYKPKKNRPYVRIQKNFPNLAQATVPGAPYSVLLNFAGLILAYAFRKYQS